MSHVRLRNALFSKSFQRDDLVLKTYENLKAFLFFFYAYTLYICPFQGMPGKHGKAGKPGQKGSLVSNYYFCFLLLLILKYVSCVDNSFRNRLGTVAMLCNLCTEESFSLGVI